MSKFSYTIESFKRKLSDISLVIKRVFSYSENIDSTSNVYLPGILVNSLNTVGSIEKAATARLDAADNCGKETSGVTGRTGHKTFVKNNETKIPTEKKIIGKSSNEPTVPVNVSPVKEGIEENKGIDDGLDR